MAFTTKFLNLLKPQPNEYINVTTQISDNFDKIDTGVEKLNNEKFDKTGGTVTGEVTITENIIGNKAMNLTGVLTASDVYLTSDKRLKSNICKIESPVEKLKKINGYTFNWIENGEKSGGVIAQELLEVIPELVIESNNYYRVNYNGVIALLIEANKALIKEIEKLKESGVR